MSFIRGWGQAEGFVLEGDSALRERTLARYSYVYDVGDLWRHYTGKGMIFHLWVVRASAVRKKRKQISDFRQMAKKAIDLVSGDWQRLIALARNNNYKWVKKPMFMRLWSNIDYRLEDAHFEGLNRFYEDCVELGVIEDPPQLETFDG